MLAESLDRFEFPHGAAWTEPVAMVAR
jgi:hypothetical protein